MHSSRMRTARSSIRRGGLHQTPPWSEERPPYQKAIPEGHNRRSHQKAITEDHFQSEGHLQTRRPPNQEATKPEGHQTRRPHPQTRHPPTRHPPDQAPLGADTPLGADPPGADTPHPKQTPHRADTPL